MRIVQIVQKPQWRGAEIFASQLSNHLLAAGHDVLMISLLPGEVPLPFKGSIIYLNRGIANRLLDIEGWRQLAYQIKLFNPDVVQANAGDTLKYAVFSKWCFRWKAPIIFRNANMVSGFVDSVVKKIFNKWLIGQVAHVISVSELCRLDFVRTYSFDPSRTITIPIGLELENTNLKVPPDLASIFESGSILVNVAGFVPEKNHAGLLRIFAMISEAVPDCKLLLIGEGKLKQEIAEQIKKSGLETRVIILGHRSDVLSIICHAKALLLPSTIEGLPAVILEAMYVKTPVVANAVGGISEVVKPGETGWLISVGDEPGFARSIEEMLRSEKRIRIIENAHQLVIKDFDNKLISQKFLEAYKKISRADIR